MAVCCRSICFGTFRTYIVSAFGFFCCVQSRRKGRRCSLPRPTTVTFATPECSKRNGYTLELVACCNTLAMALSQYTTGTGQTADQGCNQDTER